MGANKEGQTDLANLTNIQAQLAQASAATPQELADQAQLGQIGASATMGIMGAQDTSKNPIPMGLITGQQANIASQANAASQPLSAQLASLQATRQSALDADTSSLQSAQDIYDQYVGQKEAKASLANQLKIAQEGDAENLQVSNASNAANLAQTQMGLASKNAANALQYMMENPGTSYNTALGMVSSSQ